MTFTILRKERIDSTSLSEGNLVKKDAKMQSGALEIALNEEFGNQEKKNDLNNLDFTPVRMILKSSSLNVYIYTMF